MPRPGVDVVVTEAAATGGAVLDTSQGFFIGTSERGPVDTALAVRSLKEFEKRYGERTGPAITIHDSVRGFFTERASVLHFARLSGATAAAASSTVGVVEAAALSPGVWGNDVTVGFEAPTGLAHEAQKSTRKPNRKGKDTKSDDPEARAGEPVRVVVTYGEVVERSQPLATAQDAVDWSTTSNYVRLTTTTPAQTVDVVDPVALTGGTDDASVDASEVSTALDLFGYALGPGQVAYPGATDPDMHELILGHCFKNKRCALLDLGDEDALSLMADVQGLYPLNGCTLGAALAPKLWYPGPAQGTSVQVPYSAIQAGIISRCDRTTGNPNEAAAGTNGVSLGATGLVRDYTDDEREQLNEAGVTLAKVIYNEVRTYGSRTCAGPDNTNWMWFANSRVIMAIGHDCDAVAENYVHKQIDAKRKLFTSLEQDLGGVCLRYVTLEAVWDFFIDTGPAVNTPDTIAAGEIHAVVGVKTGPSAEWVRIEISKTPLTA